VQVMFPPLSHRLSISGAVGCARLQYQRDALGRTARHPDRAEFVLDYEASYLSCLRTKRHAGEDRQT